MSVTSTGRRPGADGQTTLPARGAGPAMRMRGTGVSSGRHSGAAPCASAGRPGLEPAVPRARSQAPTVPGQLVPRPRVPVGRARMHTAAPGSARVYRSAAAAGRPARPHLRLVKPADEDALRGAVPRSGHESRRQPRPLTRAADSPQARYTGTARPRAVGRVSGPGRRAGVRLTRRGRIVLTAFLVCLALVAVGLTAAARAQAASSGTSPASLDRSMTRVVVQPGQTLWSIAVRAAPAGDPRVVMQRIVDVNALQGTTLQPGQQLWVPKG